MELLVALDLLDGQLVRLRQGRFDEVRAFGDPLAYLERALVAGARWFHVVDLSRARDPSSRLHRDLLGQLVGLVREAGGSIEVGGGIRTAADVAELVSLGASRVVVGTALLAGSLELTEGETIVAALDYRRDEAGRRVVVAKAWQELTGVDVVEGSRSLYQRGVRYQLLTDVGRDGMGRGPDRETYAALVETVPVAVVASGGIARPEDLAELACVHGREGAVWGAVVGTALLDGSMTIEEALEACRA